MNIDYFRKCRNMPFVRVGMRVFHMHNRKFGRISGANDSANLNIKFDGKNYSENCHPKWKMKYYDKEMRVIAEYRG